MAIGNLFGSGGESNSLYGTSLTSGGSIPAASSFIYFEWFIFKTSASQPALPTGGSWDFLTNTGTPPTGWTSTVSGVPLDNLWFSIAFVDSRNPTNFTWSTPGLISATTSIYATAYADTFTGTGSTTNWTLTQDPVVVNNLDVSINGVTQTPTTDYTISGTTFTTTTAAPLGSIILVKYRQALPNSYFGTANNVGYTPSGWIAATNVQSALNEVAADISATDGVSGSNLVGYKPAGTGAVATTVQAKLRQWVSVIDFGADPTGATESTSAFTNALTASKFVYIPSGTYLIDQINITQAGTRLFTAGMSVTIQQKNTAGRTNSPIINVKVSDVSIGDMKFIGNIATDADEYNHCINIVGTGSEVRNITLGNYYATNIRGDVLYVGGTSSIPVYDVNVISLDGDNIYRSICSVTGGHGVRVQQILGKRVGYRNIDFESNTGSQTVDDCWVGYVRGGCIQLASDSSSVRVGSIQIDQLELDTAFMPAPTPRGSFTNPAGPDIAILATRWNFLKIGSLKINGFGSIGVNLSNATGEAKGRFIVDYIEATNIAPSGAYQAVIVSDGAALVEINSGKVTLTSGSGFVKGTDADYSLRNIEFVGTNTANLAAQCTDLYCENLSGNFGSGNIFGSVANGQVINSRLTTTSSAMYQCIDMSWYNCVLACVNFDLSSGSGSKGAAFYRGLLNTVWYDAYQQVASSGIFANFIGVAQGTGTPEGVLAAPVGTLYVNTSGSTSTTLYVKTSGTGNTGWTAK